MPRFGGIGSATDAPNKAQRSGTVAVIITDLSKVVTFATAMPSSSYRVFLQEEANLAAVLWPSAKNTTDFTLNLSAGVTGNVSYLVVED